MYKYELVKLLEKVLYPSYEMKGGEHFFHCPFCNHHKKKTTSKLVKHKSDCWVCNQGGHKIGILLRKINSPKQIISEVLKYLVIIKVLNMKKMKRQNIMFHYHNVINHFVKNQPTHCIKI